MQELQEFQTLRETKFKTRKGQTHVPLFYLLAMFRYFKVLETLFNINKNTIIDDFCLI